MADKATLLLLEGLGRAAADPEGLPLHPTRTGSGLFGANPAGKLAAQRGKDEGLLRVVRTETSGRSPVEICALTEKGLAYLLQESSPRQVLEDLLRALERRHTQAGDLIGAARQMQTTLDALKATTERVLAQLGTRPVPPPATNGAHAWVQEVLAFLTHRHEAGAPADCPLPDLFRHAQTAAPTLSIGAFHDGLRRLHDEERIYLHPWTGPLYDLPEPSCALLVGHEVAYYASLRSEP